MLNFRECDFTSKGYKNIWSHPQPHPAPCPVAQDHHAVSVPSQLCWDRPGGWILRWDDLGTSQSRRLLPDIISHPTISSNVKSDFCSKNIWISFGWVKNMWNHPTSNQLKIPTGTFQQWRTKMAPLTKMEAENLGTRVGVFFFEKTNLGEFVRWVMKQPRAFRWDPNCRAGLQPFILNDLLQYDSKIATSTKIWCVQSTTNNN